MSSDFFTVSKLIFCSSFCPFGYLYDVVLKWHITSLCAQYCVKYLLCVLKANIHIVQRILYFPVVHVRDMRVNLRSLDGFMPKHLLNKP